MACFLISYHLVILNGGFQQALAGWSAIGNATRNVIADPQPLSAEFPNSLEFTVGSDIDQVGFENSGFGGIPFNESLTYMGSFFMRFPIESTFGGIINTGIMGPGESTILASAPGELVGAFDGQWLHIQFTLQNTGRIVTSTDNTFFVSVDAQPWIGQIVHFTSFSLHSS
ncbi:hypothetical protein C8Q75DRAFT_450431 [Abortiporus biennis]|nr:hypothetical protein C8Q75DRAFT_450431 [Abortiporus biennis]